MIFRILKSNQPVNYILVPLIGVLFWTKSLIKPVPYQFYPGENKNVLYSPIDNLLKDSALIQSITALVLIIILAIIVQQINSRYAFIRVRTLLPAPLFILMISGFTEIHALHPVFFATAFLLLAIHRLFSIFNKPKSYSAIFDTGFLLGIGSLFYFNLVAIFPAFLFAITILTREFRWREAATSIVGFLTPFLLALGFVVLNEQFMELLKTFEQNIITANNHFKPNDPLLIFLGFLLFLTLIGSIKIIQQYDTKKVSSRKYFTVLFLIFIFSMAGIVFIPATSQEMLVILAIPVSFLVSNFLVFLKRRFWGELIITLLFGIIIYMQFLAQMFYQ